MPDNDASVDRTVPRDVGWTHAEYIASPVAIGRLHDYILDLEGEVERMREGWDADVDWANGLLKQRDKARRLFNRLDAAITHHRRDCEANDVPDIHDQALWAARDRVLRDAR